MKGIYHHLLLVSFQTYVYLIIQAIAGQSTINEKTDPQQVIETLLMADPFSATYTHMQWYNQCRLPVNQLIIIISIILLFSIYFHLFKII